MSSRAKRRVSVTTTWFTRDSSLRSDELLRTLSEKWHYFLIVTLLFYTPTSYRFLIHSFSLGDSVYVPPTITAQMQNNVVIIFVYVGLECGFRFQFLKIRNAFVKLMFGLWFICVIIPTENKNVLFFYKSNKIIYFCKLTAHKERPFAKYSLYLPLLQV